MFRLIALLLILGGIAAAGLGGWSMLNTPNESSDSAAPAAPAPGAMAPGFDAGSDGDDIVLQPESMTSGPQEEALRRLPIAHQSPRTARYGAPFEVTLAIDATGAESATGALSASGTIVEGEAHLGSDARAVLIGRAFEIEELSPRDQGISTLTANTWRWDVTPVESGAHDLVMEIYAIADGRALPVRSFRDTVTVEVSTLRQAVSFAQSANPLAMLLGGIGSVIGGLATAARVFRG